MLNNKTIRNQIFSITDNYHNNVKRIVITILGIKIKFKREIIDNIRYLLKQSSIVENNGENNKFIVLDENGNKTDIKYIIGIGMKMNINKPQSRTVVERVIPLLAYNSKKIKTVA